MASTRTRLLADYLQKRDFKKTTEPKEARGKANRQLIIQKHFARRLHFDLRLEINGVLVSWAVTRGPSANPHDKRLAVRTEDHPLSYGTFEGTIPAGQYGGGTVVLWESTTFTPLNGDPAAALKAGEIKFESHGTRLRGRWVLVRMKTDDRKENWLLIKERDSHVEDDDTLALRFTTGVLSGRSPKQIENKGAPKSQNKPQHTPELPLPTFVPPQLCETSNTVPTGSDWAFELKYDGYRLILCIGGGECIAYTRTGLDWSSKFPAIVGAAKSLACQSAILDAEAVIFDEQGMTNFPALVNALETKKTNKISGVVFDLLALDGESLRQQPYIQRKAMLKKLLGHSPSLRFADHIIGNGEALFEQVSKAGGEGIIAKQVMGVYQSGLRTDWTKIKTNLRTDVNIIGYMPSTKHDDFASLLAARETPAGLAYVGRVGTGYNKYARKTLAPFLTTTAEKPGLSNVEKLPTGAIYIKRPFAAEIQFGGWTMEGQMRQARFISVQNDRPTFPRKAAAKPASGTPAKPSTPWRITHPNRILFPETGVTKAMIAQYYQSIWPRLQKHLVNRPVSLLRVPDSIEAEKFFQRHPLKGMKDGVVLFGPSGEQYFAIDGEIGLATVVQFGTVELHGWNAVQPDLDHPDRIIFDLDPDEALPFSKVKTGALILRDYFEAAGIQSLPLLSGGKGIHLVIPLNKSNTAKDVEFFSGAFAKSVAADRPEIFVATLSKAKRKGKILIDYFRNRKKATAIIPWSVRARPGAPIAAPVAWNALNRYSSAQHFNTSSYPLTDDWDQFWTLDQALSNDVIRTLQARSKKF
jgi:bifunctional non-homologous end joining protein LigD